MLIESKRVVDSGFHTVDSGFRIPTVGFRIPSLWIPDSKLSVIPDSNVLNSGFHSYSKGQYFLYCIWSRLSKQESSFALHWKDQNLL